MKITKINMPDDETTGLKNITMSQLGQLVLITGKNGSGKTRLFEKIKTTFDAEGISIPFPQRDVHVYNNEVVSQGKKAA